MKRTYHIKDISGVNTNPFLRFSEIPIDQLIELLTTSKNEVETLGFSNVKVSITEDGGMVDISLYGDKDLTPSEIKEIDSIDTIFRNKPISDDGLSREDEIYKNLDLGAEMKRIREQVIDPNSLEKELDKEEYITNSQKPSRFNNGK